MKESIISLYPHIKETKKGFDIKFSTFLENIKDGYWQDQVLAYRNDKTKENKAKLPYVTISGTFKTRNNEGIEQHSGFIAMDLDGISNVHDLRDELACDPYFYAIFVSCGGSGLCAISRINPKAHLESFNYLSEYLYKKYGITEVDEHCKDVSRPRFVSYDPDLYINKDAQLLHIKPEVAKKKKLNSNYVYVESDFSNVIKKITDRCVDITENYGDWINIGFALASKFGESGRDMFHGLSSVNSEYSYEKCDKKYSHLLRTGVKNLDIGVIYNLAKKHNIELYSNDTRTAIVAAKQAKKGSRTLQSVTENLQKFSDIPEAKIIELKPIIEKAFNENVAIDEQNDIQDIKDFLTNNYKLRRNEISRNIELSGKPLNDIDINSIYIDCRSVLEKASKDLVTSVIFSNFTPSYNPLLEFIQEYQGHPKGNIDKLIASIKTNTENYEMFITKWLVSMMAAVHGKHSPLMLVLCGGQNTGKTEWFRRLLPDKLSYYYAENKLDEGKDSEILMTKKLIIMDDEMGGKSKQEQKKLKEMTSKQTFSVREPYGRVSVDLERLAMLCGTTNDDEILNDPTGNRRILPVRVLDIDRALYNSINKYHLFIEIYNLFKSGYDYNLSKLDIVLLNDSTHEFIATNQEQDLILKYYRKPTNSIEIKTVTSTEIMSNIKIKAQVQLSVVKIGITLKNLGFERKMKKVENKPLYCWEVVEL